MSPQHQTRRIINANRKKGDVKLAAHDSVVCVFDTLGQRGGGTAVERTMKPRVPDMKVGHSYVQS